jgi:hypothetical protein
VTLIVGNVEVKDRPHLSRECDCKCVLTMSAWRRRSFVHDCVLRVVHMIGPTTPLTGSECVAKEIHTKVHVRVGGGR